MTVREKEAFIAIDILITLFVITSFSLFYFRIKENILTSQIKLTQNEATIKNASKKYLFAMYEPLDVIINDNSYRLEHVSSQDVKIFLKNNKLFSDTFVLRRN